MLPREEVLDGTSKSERFFFGWEGGVVRRFCEPDADDELAAGCSWSDGGDGCAESSLSAEGSDDAKSGPGRSK